jgi:hypothetical protein
MVHQRRHRPGKEVDRRSRRSTTKIPLGGTTQELYGLSDRGKREKKPGKNLQKFRYNIFRDRAITHPNLDLNIEITVSSRNGSRADILPWQKRRRIRVISYLANNPD